MIWQPSTCKGASSKHGTPVPPWAHLFLELHVHQVRLHAVALPVRVLPPISQQLHPVARLGARHAPHRHVPDLAGPRVRLQRSHHCSGARRGWLEGRRRQAQGCGKAGGVRSHLLLLSSEHSRAAPHPPAAPARQVIREERKGNPLCFAEICERDRLLGKMRSVQANAHMRGSRPCQAARHRAAARCSGTSARLVEVAFSKTRTVQCCGLA